MKSLIMSAESIDTCLKFEFWRPHYWVISLDYFSFDLVLQESCYISIVETFDVRRKNDNSGRYLWTFGRFFP